MKGKKLVLMLVAIIVALSAAVMVACPDEPERVPGPETGTYYYEVGGKEYTLMLMDVDQFVEVNGGEGIRTGTYVLNGSELTLTYPVSSKEEVAETKVGRYDGGNGSITFAVDGVERTYLALKSFDVTFVLSEGRTEVQSVKNGKTAIRPEDPEKEGYEFRGWYSDEKCTKPYAFEGTPILNEGLKIYARWVEQSHQDEYVIDFDLGYEAIGPEAMLTRNGKITDMPSDPTREGYTFAGWWISDYEDGAKLTVKYEEGREFKANTTLFAVWTANGNEQPVVSVNGSGISWAAKNGTVKVTVKGPKGFTALEQDVNGTVMAVNFGSAPAGDYEITVIDGSKSTTVYYRNKALDRVSRFSVDGSVLRYDGVANATRYYVSVVCGNEKHNHAYIDNDNKLYFDFTDCTMVREGIKFVVTAHADGYADSLSEEYVCIKELAKVEGFAYDKASGKLSWNSVENARSYVITVNGKATALTVNEYSFKGYAKGEYEIKVSAFAKGYAESVASEYSLVKNELSTPSNVKLANSVLSWDGVEGAQNYTVRVGNTEYEAEGTSYDLSGIVMVEAQDYEIVVRANAASASENSAWSDVLDARYHALKDSLTYRENKVRWTAVIGAEKYEVKVNNGAAKTVDDGSTNLEVALTRKGVNEITVRYYDGMRWSKTVSVEVVAYMVRYDGRNGKDAGAVYVAVGDKVKLPSVLNPGYEFDGWYDTYDGAASNGGEYKEIVYSEAKDTVLYADWTPGTFRMVYVDGDGNRYEKEVVFGTEFSFDPPASDAEDGMFVGWYTGTNGTGVPLTDVDGVGLKPWNSVADVYIYPYYSSNALSFTLKADDTYQVIKGLDIAKFNKITVPATYNGKKVSTIGANAFNSCNTITVINIPDSIEIIEVSTAFRNMKNLIAVNIYETGTINAPRYSSDDGVLYAEDVAGKEISYFPAGKSGEYAILPDTIRIPAKVFYQVKSLTHVTIPASVSIIAQSAFEDCKALTDIVFEEPSDGQSVSSLNIAKYAFQKCTALQNITFPARLAQFDTTIFTGCVSLQRININENCANIASVDGIVTTKDKTKIIYCPIGRSGNLRVSALVTEIGDNAFDGCALLKEIRIPHTVLTIGNKAFYNSGITSVKFEGSPDAQPSTIKASAFERCYSLQEIVFEEGCGVAAIGSKAFYYCNYLFNLDIPASVKQIGSLAFANCAYIKTINFMDGVTDISIAEDAFLKCSGVNKVCISATMSTLPVAAISQCPNLYEVEISAQNTNFKSEDGYVTSLDGETVYYCGKNKAFEDGKLILSDKIKNIGDGAFRYNTRIREVVIGKNIVSIGFGAFADNDRLAKLSFEENGTEDLVISAEAFMNLTRLTEVTFADRVVSIGDKAFKNCRIESIAIPDRVVSIGDEAFMDNSKLTSVSFTENATVNTFGERAFANTMIINIELPASTETIKKEMFANCVELQSVTFADGAKISEIPEYFLQKCAKLKKIYIPTSIRSVGKYAFNACPSLVEVEFGYGGEEELTIGSNAFSKSDALKTIALPSRLVALGGAVFQNCTALNTVTFTDPAKADGTVVPSKLRSIGNSAFNKCDILEITLPGSLGNGAYVDAKTEQTLALGNMVFSGNAHLKKAVFEEGEGTGNGLTFGTYLFQNCEALEEVTFPSRMSNAVGKNGNVISFYSNTLFGCSSLKTINIGEGCELYRIIDGMMFKKDSEGEFTILFTCPQAKEGVVVVPYYVKTISEFAFTDCAKITSVTFEETPEGKTEVPLVTLSSTVSAIGTFVGTTFKTIKLPSRLTTLGDRTFFNSGLETITIPTTIRDIGNTPGVGKYAFGGTSASKPSKLKSITFEDDAEAAPLTIADSAFAYCISLTKLEFRTNTVKLGKYAVAYCNKLASVTFKDGMKYFDNYSVSSNNILTSISWPTDAEFDFVGVNAFASNKKLDNIVLPVSKQYKDNIYTGCLALKTVTVPKKMKTVNGIMKGVSSLVEWKAEADCENFKAVDGVLFSKDGKTLINYPMQKTGDTYTIPSDVETIGLNIGGTNTYAIGGFTSNTKLKKIVIPKSVRTISAASFYKCTSISSLTFEKPAEGETANDIWFGAYCFAEMTSLTSFEVPARTAADGLGERFLNNTKTSNKLASVTFEEGCRVTTLPKYSLSFSKITTITLPKSITKISDGTFFKCFDLKTIIVDGEARFENFGLYAFGYCDSLSIETVNNLIGRVSSTGNFTFAYSADIAGEIVIPAGITKVTQSMFREMKNITKVTLPSTITSIENFAFNGCTSLKEIVIPSSVTKLGRNVFGGCTSLEKIVLPSSITTVDGEKAFENCTSLTDADIACASIGKEMFVGCKNLKNVTLREGLFTIGTSAFAGCTSIEKLEIPASVRNEPYDDKNAQVRGIETKAFENCSSIKTLIFAEGGTDGLTIGDNAFSGCSALENVSFTERLVNARGKKVDEVPTVLPAIGDYAFANCFSLASLENLGLVEGIGDYAFAGTAITTAYMPATLTHLGASPYMGCKLTSIELEAGNNKFAVKDGALYDREFTRLYAYPIAREGALEIPSTVEIIAEGVFAGSNISGKLVLPPSITSISDNSFNNCRLLEEVVLPSEVTSIGESAFEGCVSLRSINLTETEVTSIGASAFYGCSKLDVEIPLSVTEFGEKAFMGSGIKSITISAEVEAIPDRAFKECYNLTTVKFEDDGLAALYIGNEAFMHCTSLVSINLPYRLNDKSATKGIYAIGISAFEGCTSLKDLDYMPSDIALSFRTSHNVTISRYAFRDCVSLESANIHPQVTGSISAIVSSRTNGVQRGAFVGCEKLKTLTFNKSANGRVLVIAEDTFTGCTALETVIFPDSLAYIGENAFRGTGIKGTINIYCSVAANAFADCVNLETLNVYVDTVSFNTVSLFEESFRGCTSLTTVNVSRTNLKTTVGLTLEDMAFYGCTSLAAFNIDDKEELNVSVASYGTMVFGKCAMLPEHIIGKESKVNGSISDVVDVTYEEGNGNFVIENGIMYDLSKTVIMGMPIDKINEPLPATVTTIGAGAFAGLQIGEYTLPTQIIDIQDYAFAGSTITKFTVTGALRTLGEGIFKDCTSLKEVVLGDAVLFEKLPEYTFENCVALTKINLPVKVNLIEDACFKNCSSLLTIGETRRLSTIEPYSFYGCTSLTIDLSETAKIYEKAFYGTSFTSLNLTFCTYVGEGTFENCSLLKEVTVGKPETIGIGAFRNCEQLKTVTLGGSGLKLIHDEAFMNCRALESLTVNNTVESLGRRAFKDCVSLRTISSDKFACSGTIVNEGDNIPESAFENCASLTEFVFNANIKAISRNAFKGCTSLKNLVVPGAVESIAAGVFDGWSAGQTITFNRSGEGSKFVGNWNSGCNAKIEFAL